MGAKSRVAVILATYNGASFIEEQLASIKQQLAVDWHLFIRDDGSNDETLAQVTSVVDQSRVTIIESDGWLTGSPAGNFFAALTKIDIRSFDYLSFCDQDDVWAPNKLKRAIFCLKESGSEGYSSDLIAFDNYRGRAWYVNKSNNLKNHDYLFQGASAGCTYVLTRYAAEEVKRKVAPLYGRFPCDKSHDWTIYAICRSHGMKWYQDTTASIFYRQHPRNAYGALPNIKGLHARLSLARSGWYRNHVLWLREFLTGSPDEISVMNRVSRLGWNDRLWLARRCFHFRRTRRDALLLAISILSGSF